MNNCLWIIIFSLLSVTAAARLELSLLRPVEEFLTNNRELVVEGVVECPTVQRVAVSVNTPAGVSDLGSLEESLQSLTVDLGASHSLTALVLSPVFDGKLSLGPRLVNLSFSGDGENFEDKGIFNCTSGMGQENGEAWVEFGMIIEARVVQIDILDGWQADGIGIREVGFLDAAGELLGARIRGISVALDLDENGAARFQMAILLKGGENHIFIVAKGLYNEPAARPTSIEEIEEELAMVMVTYMPEVVVEEEPLILSDGYKAELIIPTGALRPEIKKISIRPLDVNEIEWVSYSGNLQILKGTSPILSYGIEVSAATPFPATAKDSLERQPPGLAVDGNPRYPSTWMTTLSALPVWLKIDLREPRPIGKVIVIARVEDDVSYGPKRLSILISDDDENYYEAAVCDECSDEKTEIVMSTIPTARYVKIVIEDGKQGNNVQINEIEFRDDEGGKIVSYIQLSSVALIRPAELTLLYDDLDLTAAGVQTEENLAIFGWNKSMQEWEMVGGKVDPANNWVAVNLNHLSTFALFEAVPSVAEVRWSYNPFSPNGDGIADTTTISINLNNEAGGQARVEIFDYTGKLVRTLVYEEVRSGHISVVWDGKDENGNRVSIGPYIYQLSIGKEIRNGVLVVAR